MEHGARKHALLSASGASRWLNCTPSARLEEKFQESAISSPYAEEGTLAHEIAELELRKYYDLIPAKTYTSEIKKLRKHPLYYDGMEEEVEKYTTFVKETYAEARVGTPDAVILLEERLDFSHYVEGGFGTGDVCIIADGVLHVIDLKFGKGVEVSADFNSQLMLYGLGALRQFDTSFEIEKVRLTIIQPRLDNYSSWEDFADELVRWGDEVVKPKAIEATKGEGTQTPGSWCKWCKVKAMCKALADQNVALARLDFQEPQLLTDVQILGIYKQLPMLVDWANAVDEYMLSEAVKGKKWEGLKVVESRSNRKWSDEDKVKEVLGGKGFTPDQFTTTKLKGLGDIEKLVGKAEFPELLNPYIVKPMGAPTLVPESDKRQPYGLEQAKSDFSEPCK